MKKSYNIKQQEEISNILKQLPKVDAPDNFEFNLMAKIENNNFGDLKVEKKQLGFFWKLTPTVAVAVSCVIMFFVWSDQSVDIENPLMVMPKQIAVAESVADLGTDANDVAGTVNEAVAPNSNVNTEDELYRVVVRSNDAVSHERVALNFDNRSAVDLDSYIGGQAQPIRAAGRTRLVGGGESLDFNGFYIKEQTDRKLLESIKSRVDSIRSERSKKAEEKANLPQ